MDAYLQIDNRHTGEWLRLRRVREHGVEVLELEGGVPPGGEGPPEHIHFGQVEEGFVVSGALTASVDGKRVTLRAGESTVLPADVPHRWWNEGNEPLVFKGRAIPAGELDRFLQAIFAIVNAGPRNRPSKKKGCSVASVPAPPKVAPVQGLSSFAGQVRCVY